MVGLHLEEARRRRREEPRRHPRRALDPRERSPHRRPRRRADPRPRRLGLGPTTTRRRPHRHLLRRHGHLRRPAVPRPPAPCPGRPGGGLRRPRRRAAPRGRPQADPRRPRRRPDQPPPLPARGRDHRRPGAPGHRPGLRPGHLRRRPALLRHAVHPGRQPQGGHRPASTPTTRSKTTPAARSLELRKLLRRFLDVCNAIDYAHCRGVLHRDIKPGNIIVGKHGETLVVDWGLAKAMGRAEPGRASGERTLVPASASGSAETLPGSALGTPAFMSPEQAAGDLDRLGPAQRRLQPGRHALLPADRPAAVRGGRPRRGAPRRAAGRVPAARAARPVDRPGAGGGLPQGDGDRPEDRYASPRRWPRTSSGGWPTSPSRRTGSEPRPGLRWGRRNRPLVVGMSVSLVAAIAALSVGNVLVGRQRAEAVRQRDRARENFVEAEHQREVAVTTTRGVAEREVRTAERQLYVNRVNLVLCEVNANEINGSPTSLLAACPAALRGGVGLRSRPRRPGCSAPSTRAPGRSRPGYP